MAKEPIVWVTAFINPKLMFSIESELLKHKKYKGVKPYIPSVRIMTKQAKGKQHFQTIPLLFNYGFFKVPKYYIPNSHFLLSLKRDVKAIIGWVKDPGVTIERGMFGPDNLHNPLGVAIVSKKEILRIKDAEKTQPLYTAQDIEALQPGKIITLHTYPFEGLPAEIIEVREKQKVVRVRLLLQTSMKILNVGFENVFFSTYREEYLSDRMREEYLDDLSYRHPNIEDALDNKNQKKNG